MNENVLVWRLERRPPERFGFVNWVPDGNWSFTLRWFL